jgi:C-terminal processing protease CtpA/Prc
MKKIKHLSLILALIFSGLIFNSCSKEETLIETPTLDEIDEFIWTGLHDYYLWYKNVPNLASNKTNQQLINFLEPYTDHKKLFNDLLYQYGTVDKWSWIVDDYDELNDYFQGISVSMGWDLNLIGYGPEGDENVMAAVRYIIPGTPADNAGVKRGDVIYKINGQVPHVSNYENLFFATANMTVEFAKLIDFSINPISGTKSLVAAEVNENPVHLIKTFDNVNGKRVGYLVYNGFTSSYDEALNDAFINLQGIDELIVDLRYNSGGAIKTAIYLASMIHSTDPNKILAKSQYNDKYEAFIVQEKGHDELYDYFTNKITFKEDENKADIIFNSLNLSRAYFITSSSSASASELVINGLKPYMDIVIIGDTTSGKYFGSTTIYDRDNQGNINPNHKYAMQPIIVQIENSLGNTYPLGIFPTPGFLINEDVANLIPFGDENEPLLKTALDYIRGITPSVSSQLKTVGIQFKSLGDSKDYIPFGKDMYVEGIQIR